MVLIHNGLSDNIHPEAISYIQLHAIMFLPAILDLSLLSICRICGGILEPNLCSSIIRRFLGLLCFGLNCLVSCSSLLGF